MSEKFALLQTDTSRMLYLMIIPHTDDYGRASGKPFDIKHTVVPAIKITEATIDKCLKELHEVGLIDLYGAENKIVLQITNFDTHQQGLHKRTHSKYPDKQKENGTSRKFPEIPNNSSHARGSEGKGIEENRTEENNYKYVSSEPESDSKLKILFDYESEKFLNISEQQLELWKEAYPAVDVKREILKAAIWAAANPNKRKKLWKRFLVSWLGRTQERGGNSWGKQKEEVEEYLN